MKQPTSIFAALLLVVLVACNDTANTTEETPKVVNASAKLYAGEFIYGADAAALKDCKSNKQYPVTGGEAYLNLERAYLDSDHDAFEPEWVQVEGHLEEQVGSNGAKELFLVVDNFIGLEEGRQCE